MPTMRIRRRTHRSKRGPQGSDLGSRRLLALVMIFVLGLSGWNAPLASAQFMLEDSMTSRSMMASHQDGCDDDCRGPMPMRCPAPCALLCLMLPVRTVAGVLAEPPQGEWARTMADLRTGREIDVDDPPPRG